MMRLFSYWRSTTSYRVRIALQIKGIPYKIEPINLVKGEHQNETYSEINPSQAVPSLKLENGNIITQSMAILNYLDKTHPVPLLLPKDILLSAKVEAASMLIASDIHSINNLKVGNRLKYMGHTQDEVNIWMNYWMSQGLKAFSELVSKDGPLCFGSAITLADVCLVPQLYNAHRWGTDLKGLEHLLKIEKNCLDLEAFQQASPEAQLDKN